MCYLNLIVVLFAITTFNTEVLASGSFSRLTSYDDTDLLDHEIEETLHQSNSISDQVDSFKYARELERRIIILEDNGRKYIDSIDVLGDKLLSLERKIKTLSSELDNMKVKASSIASEEKVGSQSSSSTDNLLSVHDSEHAQDLAHYDKCTKQISNDNKNALSCFIDFNESYPDSNMKYMTYYWIGELYYLTQEYDSASKSYLQSYKLKPKGSQAPAAVFKFGLSMRKIGDDKEACRVFKSIFNEFPVIPSVIKIRTEKELEELNSNNACS